MEPSKAAMDAPDMSVFQQRIRETRKARGMSLDAVAEASGFTKSHVWELECGKSRNPTVRAVWSLARALCVSPAYLLGMEVEQSDLDPLALKLASIINLEIERRSSPQ
ncbi:helix-turn-helix domain-containing protein [Novosphingobium mathurense]|uniref:Transcriptional regulator, contains XRE-family HTH domain n=1 Tax=Novosphingobium mathurense TaxID=428990 RepID=A0A1U6I6J0_9SPHN|nr:helix-turn-helix transcriptional regulator [Novosphingobium mathurense]SLK03625.1 Transcriptional regulator, contains XRE-family HTH domain [Novosphingobium mathurense]